MPAGLPLGVNPRSRQTFIRNEQIMFAFVYVRVRMRGRGRACEEGAAIGGFWETIHPEAYQGRGYQGLHSLHDMRVRHLLYSVADPDTLTMAKTRIGSVSAFTPAK